MERERRARARRRCLPRRLRRLARRGCWIGDGRTRAQPRARGGRCRVAAARRGRTRRRAPVPTHRADCDVEARDCSPRPTHRALCEVDARDISPACAQASERGVLVRGPVGIIGTSGRLPFSNSAVTAEYSCIAASSSSVSMCPAASFSAMLRPPGVVRRPRRLAQRPRRREHAALRQRRRRQAALRHQPGRPLPLDRLRPVAVAAVADGRRARARLLRVRRACGGGCAFSPAERGLKRRIVDASVISVRRAPPATTSTSARPSVARLLRRGMRRSENSALVAASSARAASSSFASAAGVEIRNVYCVGQITRARARAALQCRRKSQSSSKSSTRSTRRVRRGADASNSAFASGPLAHEHETFSYEEELALLVGEHLPLGALRRKPSPQSPPPRAPSRRSASAST